MGYAKKKISLSLSIAAAIMTLAACGGSSADSPSATAKTQNKTQPITVEGSAPLLNDTEYVSFLMRPTLSPGHFPSSMTTASIPAASFASTPEGAFTTLPEVSSGSYTLNSGVIADVSGDGVVSIGRWTDGEMIIDNLGVSKLGANDGAHYFVGTRLAELPDTSALTCSLARATTPTNGKQPLAPLTPEHVSLNSSGQRGKMAVELGFASASSPSDIERVGGITVSNGMSAIDGYATVRSQWLGTDVNKPKFAVAYAVNTSTHGAVHGVAVFDCTAK